MSERDAVIDSVLSRDASQLAATERQRLLSRLMPRLAHEIRNPLGSLDVHVQLLEEDLARESPEVFGKVTSRLSIIRTELHRLDDIVRQFLDLAGPSAVHAQRMDVAEAIHQVRQLLGADAAAREIELKTELPAELPALVADKGQFIQALVNLVINGIQAAERRGRVTIAARREEEPDRLRIDVHDTGPGIDPAKALTIFEPFFTTKAEGSGLGLWIVQQIAFAHGGTISAANAPGGGALFTLRLPLHATGGVA